jgi:hypothetical protein
MRSDLMPPRSDEALLKCIDAAKKNNAPIAERLKTYGVRLSTELQALVRDAAIAQIETVAINRILADYTPMLQDANFLARGRAAVPRRHRRKDAEFVGSRERRLIDRRSRSRRVH